MLPLPGSAGDLRVEPAVRGEDVITVATFPQAAASALAEHDAEQTRLQEQRQRWVTAGKMFAASCVSMYLAWLWFSWRWTFPWLTGQPATWLDGVVYVVAAIGILFVHEMGHFLQAWRYGMPVSPPYFIPMPPPLNPFGTMGAVIVAIKGYRANRREMFDIGISGPLAGLFVALPVMAIGIAQVQPVAGDPFFGDLLLIRGMTWLIHGPLPEGMILPLSPLATAGWFGLFLTGLNMLPIGQLDGGHVCYALFGKYAHALAWGVVVVWVAAILYFGLYAWSLMVILVMLMGLRHPPTADDSVPLGPTRRIIGALSLVLPILCLTPMPIQGM